MLRRNPVETLPTADCAVACVTLGLAVVIGIAAPLLAAPWMLEHGYQSARSG